jgi:class 3 adenylate cyclase
MSYTLQIGASASQDRLENLIDERLKTGADTKSIDQRIWDLFGERWAVMFTDLSGFSRKVAEFGIIHFLQTIFESQRLLVPVIDKFDGILLKMEGDSMLVIFRNVVKALDCAQEMQGICGAYNRDKSDTDKVLLCIGIGSGMILKIGDNDVWGAEVNAASKLGEDTAKAGEILVTSAVQQELAGEAYRFEPIPELPPGSDGAFRLVY